MNIQQLPSGEYELRNRFPATKKLPSNTKWKIASQTASDAAGFVRDSLGKLGFNVTDQNFKKSNVKENARVYAAYLGIALTAITALTLFVFWSAPRPRPIADIMSDSHHNMIVGGIHNHMLHANHHGRRHWHQKVFSMRPNDVIDHKYDDLAVSILVSQDPSHSGMLQAAVSTFLSHINYLQLSTETAANSFIGGSLDAVREFQPKSFSFPKLELYIDSYLNMLKFAPSQDWFIQIDEDTYLFMENIQIFLKKYKPTDSVFFHNFDIVVDDSIHYVAKDTGHFPVSIMSRKALEMLGSYNYAQCISNHKYIASEETILVKCLLEMGVSIVSQSDLHPSEPAHDFLWPKDSCKRPLSISQLSAAQLQVLYNARPTTGRSSQGQVYKWDSVVTYADVFHHTYATNKPTAGIDRHSASDSQSISGVTSGAECREKCKSDENCVSWTFDGDECFTSSHIGVSVPRKSCVSGVIANRYNCLAPTVLTR